jgi:4-amino-4-deoxy-L-arabinose transferase-like glycosyltransferase
MKSKSRKEKKQPPKAKEPKRGESASAKFFRNPFFSSRVFEILLFCFILGLALVGGLVHLNADPPAISWSQDVATDPPQYTNFARNKVLWDSWVVYPPNRFVFFLKSFSSLASYAVFSVFGTGRSQANLVAVLLNLLTMIFLFLAMKKVFGKRAAFFSFFLLVVNYVFIMYGRNPFLEISALFLLTLGFYFAVSGFRKQALLIPSGICFAAAIFFGKTMAAFILPGCLILLLLWMFQQYSSSERRMDIRPPIYFAAGFLSVLIFWLFFSYLPAQREVAGYLGEQALGLYGFPTALKSISGFISSLFTFGTDLFYRMPVAFVLSLLGLLLFFRNRPSIREFFRRRDDRSKAAAFIVFWFLAAFFLLMILNYRPLRYQIYLIPPLCALAGLWLDGLVYPDRGKRASSGALFWVVFLVAVAFLVNYVITTLYTLSRKPITLGSSLPIALLVAVICGALYYWRLSASKRVSREATGSSHVGIRFLAALALVVAAFVVNGWQYVSWTSSPTFSLNRSSLDLAKILGPEAVISGPYGPALVWDNRLGDVIHMFGVTQPDPQLFLTYPITHLALERGGNRDRAFKDYPEVMNQSPVVATYWLRNIPVDIYRVARHTGNLRVQYYPLSDFEKAKLALDGGNNDSALVMLEQFVSRNPDNYSGYVVLAEIYFNLNDFEKSSQALERAIGFNPSDFLARQQLGTVYLNLAQQTKQDSYRLLAIDQWEKSLKLFPQNTKLAARLQSIKGY